MGRCGVYVKNRFINEIIDKVYHSSVVNSRKNKGQMLASIPFCSLRSLHSIPASIDFFS